MAIVLVIALELERMPGIQELTADLPTAELEKCL